MSFQLIVGLLMVMGTGLSSVGLSKPWMWQGPVSRTHSPPADSVMEKKHFSILLFKEVSGEFRNEHYILSADLSSVPPGDAGRGRWHLERCRPSRFRAEGFGSALHCPGTKSCSYSAQTASNNLNKETAHRGSSSTTRLLSLHLEKYRFVSPSLPKSLVKLFLRALKGILYPQNDYMCINYSPRVNLTFIKKTLWHMYIYII